MVTKRAGGGVEHPVGSERGYFPVSFFRKSLKLLEHGAHFQSNKGGGQWLGPKLGQNYEFNNLRANFAPVRPRQGKNKEGNNSAEVLRVPGAK